MKTDKVQLNHTEGKLKANGLCITSIESGKQIGQMYLMNFNHDKAGRQIKDTEGIGNADRMVKCWNMYDELINGLKYARRFLNEKNVDVKYIDELLQQAEQK